MTCFMPPARASRFSAASAGAGDRISNMRPVHWTPLLQEVRARCNPVGPLHNRSSRRRRCSRWSSNQAASAARRFLRQPMNPPSPSALTNNSAARRHHPSEPRAAIAEMKSRNAGGIGTGDGPKKNLPAFVCPLGDYEAEFWVDAGDTNVAIRVHQKRYPKNTATGWAAGD